MNIENAGADEATSIITTDRPSFHLDALAQVFGATSPHSWPNRNSASSPSSSATVMGSSVVVFEAGIVGHEPARCSACL